MKRTFHLRQFIDGQWIELGGEYKHPFAAAEAARGILAKADKPVALLSFRRETCEFVEWYFPDQTPPQTVAPVERKEP